MSFFFFLRWNGGGGGGDSGVSGGCRLNHIAPHEAGVEAEVMAMLLWTSELVRRLFNMTFVFALFFSLS